MMEQTAAASWRTNFIITAAVLTTIVMALLMSQLDRLQMRQSIPPTPVFVANLTVTAAGDTPLPTVALPSATPSPRPATATATPAAGASATAVPMLPQCGQVPAGWRPYIVKRGDTLFALAAHSGATVNEIVQANCLDPNLLLSGIQIFLPGTPPVRAVCGPPANWVRYTVQPGDTMFSLARTRETTVYAVMQANCFTTSYLVAGKQIYLPPARATATPVPTMTSTDTPVPPTETDVPPTSTATPTPTSTPTPSATPTLSITPFTPSPTATATPTQPSATPPIPVTATATATLPVTATPTATATVEPPTNTATPTAVPPTDTLTPVPTDTPTPLQTSTPPVATPTATDAPAP